MEPFIGQIQYFPWYFAIRDWAFCNGQLLSVKQYPALYSLLMNIYGGDGINTFALPDLRKFKAPGLEYQVGEKLPDGSPYMKAFIALNGIYPSRD